MLSLHSISGRAISGPPPSNDGAAVVRSEFRFEAVPHSAYLAFVMDESIPKVYAVEITMRPLTDLIAP